MKDILKMKSLRKFSFFAVILAMFCAGEIFAANNVPENKLSYRVESENGVVLTTNKFIKDERVYVILLVDGQAKKNGLYHDRLALDTKRVGTNLYSNLILHHRESGEELNLRTSSFRYSVHNHLVRIFFN